MHVLSNVIEFTLASVLNRQSLTHSVGRLPRNSDVHIVLASVHLCHLACEQALRAVAQPAFALLCNELLAQLASLVITVVIEILLSLAGAA